jgi:hypothetical protein
MGNKENMPAERPPKLLWGVRFLLVVAGLAAWFGTQRLLGARGFTGGISDALLEWSAPANVFLRENPAWANGLLIVSSAIIDGLGVFLLTYSIFGRSIRPFMGLLFLFGMRQICQGLCALPAPDGMIWNDPGFPSLLVTYGVSNDFFYSGHTAIAVFGAVELVRLGGRWVAPFAVAMVIFEAATVLVLRAHYTMDVFTGIVAALFVAYLVNYLAPPWDRAVDKLFAQFVRA